VDSSQLTTSLQPLNQPAGALNNPSGLASDPLNLGSPSSSSLGSPYGQQAPFQAVQSNPKTALIWRKGATGEQRQWVMEGATLLSTPDLPSNQNADWRLVGTNDYNNDGQPDLLRRNGKTGENVWWVMNGTTAKTDVRLPDVTDFDWQLASTADYDRDGQVDLLWRNSRTGVNAWWLMNGAQIKTTFSITPAADLNWKIVSTNDYNRDGKVDILWRNAVTGDNAWWLMNGTTLQSSVMLPTVADSAWNLAGTGDSNRDGQVDVLWRNQQTGQTVWWLMGGAQIQQLSWLPVETDLSWQIVGVTDRYTAALPTLSSSPNAAAVVASSTNQLGIAQPQVSANFSQQWAVNANDPVEVYQFSLAQSGIFTANLTNLTGDADVRLIQDINGNGRIDAELGEIKAWQWERGTRDESIRSFLAAGTYYVQVTAYNRQSANYRITTNFAPAASDSQKFLIDLQYDSTLSGLSAAARQAIRNAANFWESVIPYRSAITASNVLTINLSGQFLDYNYFAVAAPTLQSFDNSTVTIVSGVAYVNTQRLGELSANPAYLEAIMTHELGHILGLGTLWEPIVFGVGNGTSRAIGQTLINRSTATYNTISSRGTTTAASWAYGELLGNYTPTAVPIEPSVFAHWDETTFRTELMTPYAEAVGVATPASILTIASLRDIGWNVNYGAAQAYQLNNAFRALSAPQSAPASSGSSQAGPLLAASQAALNIKCGCSGCLAAIKLPLMGQMSLTEAITANS
jgi:Bacterial pre-peptidase C-terminal domain/FG-GAP-like repeat